MSDKDKINIDSLDDEEIDLDSAPVSNKKAIDTTFTEKPIKEDTSDTTDLKIVHHATLDNSSTIQTTKDGEITQNSVEGVAPKSVPPMKKHNSLHLKEKTESIDRGFKKQEVYRGKERDVKPDINSDILGDSEKKVIKKKDKSIEELIPNKHKKENTAKKAIHSEKSEKVKTVPNSDDTLVDDIEAPKFNKSIRDHFTTRNKIIALCTLVAITGGLFWYDRYRNVANDDNTSVAQKVNDMTTLDKSKVGKYKTKTSTGEVKSNGQVTQKDDASVIHKNMLNKPVGFDKYLEKLKTDGKASSVVTSGDGTTLIVYSNYGCTIVPSEENNKYTNTLKYSGIASTYSDSKKSMYEMIDSVCTENTSKGTAIKKDCEKPLADLETHINKSKANNTIDTANCKIVYTSYPIQNNGNQVWCFSFFVSIKGW